MMAGASASHTSLLVFAVLALSVAQARNLEQPRYDTAYACEGKTLKIECKDGELIHLIRANYGRFSITICNDHGNTEWSVNCMSPKSLRVLHGRCSQQQNCSVVASTSTFGDPCPGTLKYLEAHYQCMPAASTTTTNRPSPPWLITSQPSVWSTPKSATLRPAQKSAASTPESPLAAVTNAPASVTTTVASTLVTTPSTSVAAGRPIPDIVMISDSDTQPPPILPDTTTASTTTSKSTTAASTTAYISSPSMSWLDIESVQLCSPTTSRSLYWNWTRVGEVSVQPCPGGATGVARWRCTALPLTPTWTPDTPDLSECRSVWLTTLESRVEEGDDSIISIANEVAQVTSSKTLYGGDMMTTTKIIKKMAQKMSVDIQTFPDPRQREAIVTELLHGVVRTGSNLLDSTQHPSWWDLSYKEQMRVATSLLMGLEENAFLLADTVIREKTVIQSVKNILLSVRVVETRNVGTEQFPSTTALEQWSISNDWLQLPRGALIENSEGGFVRLVFVAFDRLEEILQPQMMISAVGDKIELERSKNSSRVLNSKVISASLGKGRHIQLSEPVRLSLRHIRTENVSNPACVFWDYTMSAWSDEGCRVEATNRTHTICQCDHLTNFAVLMDVHATYLQPGHQVALQIITYIGCSISVVCLLLAIITFQLFRGLKSDRTTIHKNLCGCLLVAEILFLAGIGQTDKPIVCGIVAGLLHFFFLCAFAWMFLEGFQLYVMLIEVFEAEKSRIRWYYVIAYGAPFIIVAVSCVVDPFSYGTERYCWLRADNFFIFSFVGPVIAVILANLVFLSMAIYMMCRHANTSATLKSKEHSRLASARAWLRGAIVLVFLLGLTWTFGLLYLNEESVIMAYIFTVLNSLQGLFIFVFHCVQNEKVRKEYRNFISRHSWLPKCVKESNVKERRTSLYAGSNGNPSAPNSHSTENSALSPHATSGTSYFLQREWSSRNNQGKSTLNASGGQQQRANHRVSNTSSRPQEQEVEVCVATLPYVRGRGIPTPKIPKSATTWGPLHKPLIWKNISFKSYSRDSGHGGSEQDSPRSQNTTTLNSLNNVRGLNNSKDTRRQPYIPQADYYQGHNITNDLSGCSRVMEADCVAEYCPTSDPTVSQQLQLPLPHHLHKAKKCNSNLLRSASPWNHTYTEIRDGRPHRNHHSHPEDDPVYEEIERNDIQVSDMSDEDGKRQSDISRQSSRSYGDNRPLIPYSPGLERNFPCLNRLKEQHGTGVRATAGQPGYTVYSGGEIPSARTVAVLDGDTVVCHLQPDHQFYPHEPCYNSRTMVLPPYSEC